MPFRLISIAFILISSSLIADDNESALSTEALAAFDRVKKLMQVEAPTSVPNLLAKRCDIDWSNEAEVKALMSQSEMLDQDFGLEFRAGYTTDNLQNDLSGEGSTYLELSWDVLRSGYKEQEYKAQDKLRQARIKSLEGDLKQLRLDYNCRNLQIHRAFSGTESALLAIKLELMERVYEIERRAYFQNNSYLDELLSSEEEIRLTQMNLEMLANDPLGQEQLGTITNPPVLDVHFPALIDLIKADDKALEIYKLNQLRLRAEDYDEDRSSRLRLFLRKEFDFAQSNNDGLVAGLRFQMPLTFDEGKSAQSQEYLLNQLEKDFTYEQWEIIARARNAYLSLREQLERVTKQQFRVLNSAEKIRRINSYITMDKALDDSAVIVRVLNYLNSNIELVQAKKVLYQRVNQMFLVGRIGYTPEVLKIVDLNETTHRAREHQRSVYLWSDEFNQYTNQQLAILFETKGIQEALISLGQNTNQAKFLQFLKENRDSLDIAVMTGDASWLEAGASQQALEKVNAYATLSNHIHLDIEPHTLSDYEANRAAYMDSLVALVKAIRINNPDLRLTLSVPFHWSEETYKALSDYTDGVYIMLYGTTDLDRMVERVKAIASVYGLSKTTVALRAEEVVNEFQLENYISQLATATGVKRFAIHKLGVFESDTK